jgi:hypothetical protein
MVSRPPQLLRRLSLALWGGRGTGAGDFRIPTSGS